MSSIYYKFLLEKQEEQFGRDNYKKFNIDKLSSDEQVDYIGWYMEDLKIPVTIRPSDTRNNYYFVVFQNEDQLEYAVKRFGGISGAEQHGDKFYIGDTIFKFDYDFNKRFPLNQNGEPVEHQKSGLSQLANSIRRETQVGRRLYNVLTKPNLKSLNPDF